MQDEIWISAAGRQVPDALERVRRYCGLPWQGGPPETWAWHYYDEMPTPHDDVVTAVDVLCAAALHPGLSRSDLRFFRDRTDELTTWLRAVNPELLLWQADDSLLDHLGSLVQFEPDVSITLLSKVLHRKRPQMIPLLDRHVIDWYRPVTGKRVAAEAWTGIVRAMHADVVDPERRLLLAIAAGTISHELSAVGSIDRPISWLRMIDIAIWMGSR